MTWTDPAVGSALFDTNDIPTEGNFDLYIFNNLLSLPHPYGSRETSEKGVQASTSETSLYTTPTVITGGDLGTTGTFYAYLSGRIRQGTTAGMNWTWKYKLGGAAILTDGPTAGGGATDGADVAFLIEMWIEALGSESSQRLIVQSSETAFARTTTLSSVTAAVDMTVDQSFDVTVQMGAAGANDLCFKQFSKQSLGRN